MKLNILHLICFTFIIISCKKEQTALRNFPIFETLPVSNIDSTGITFNAKLEQQGKIPTNSYGFLWDYTEPTYFKSHKIIVGTNLQTSTFEFHLDSAILVNNYTYQIRAFAIYGDTIVYGNIQTFECKGNAKSPWNFFKEEIQFDYTLFKWNYFTYNGFEYLNYRLKSNGDTMTYNYVFNPQTISLSKTDISIIPHFDTDNIFVINNSIYAYNVTDNFIYKYENSIWNKIPTSYQTFWTSSNLTLFKSLIKNCYFVINMYYNQIYKFNTITNTWENKQVNSSLYHSILGGTSNNINGYFLTSDATVWELNPDDLSCKEITKFPGKDISNQMNYEYSKLISFFYNNKLYFGFNLSEIWSYNINTHIWERTVSTPISLEINESSFNFFINNKLYIGFPNNNNNVSIWQFDPSK